MRQITCLVIVVLCSLNSIAQNYAKYSDIRAYMIDRKVEHQAVMAANKRAASLKCKESFQDAKIVSDNWGIMRNDNDKVTGRFLHMELYGATYEGKCGVAHCVVMQKMRGDDTYSPKLTLLEMGDFYTLKCE